MTDDELKSGLTNQHKGIVFPGGNANNPHHIYFEAHYSPELSHFEFLHELIENLEGVYESLAKYNAENGFNMPQLSRCESSKRTRSFLTAADIVFLREMKVGL